MKIVCSDAAAREYRLSVIFFSVLVGATLLKLLFSQLGHNNDLDAYRIVADIVARGKSVYASTRRYNYGPIWFYILAGFKWIQEHAFTIRPAESFHFYVACFLAWVDGVLAWVAWKKYRNFSAAVIFLLNPISILISGYHSQFDNFAVLVGILSVFVYTSRLRYAEYAGLTLLGISLTIKHLFIFFPVWLFFSEAVVRRGFWPRWRALCIPVLLFLFSFIPYLFTEGAVNGIIKHVFKYSSFHNNGFFPNLIGFFIPIRIPETVLAGIPIFSGTKFLWLCAMIAAGYVFRKRSLEEQVLLYTIALCVFSTAIVDQYLAIPALAACLLLPRRLLCWYFGMATLWLIFPTSSNYHVPFLAELFPKGLVLRWQAIVPLFFFLMVQLWGDWKKGQKASP